MIVMITIISNKISYHNDSNINTENNDYKSSISQEFVELFCLNSSIFLRHARPKRRLRAAKVKSHL